MVKTLHSLETISARIGQIDGRIQLTCDKLATVPIEPVAAAMRALAEPLHYPPLANSTVPGDRVALAVDAAVPCVLQIVRGAVTALTDAGVDPEAISIVVASSELAGLFRAEFTGNGASGVQVALHDPDDEANLCFVGLTKHHEPLVVNRTIFEADLVLPIGVARPHGGAFDSLYPQFSSAAVIDRHRTPANLDSPETRKVQRHHTREAGRLIGAAMVMLIVPGSGEAVAEVIAGEPRAAGKRAAELYRREWRRRSSQQARLVVGTLTGGPLAQTWENVARVLTAMRRVSDENGALALCTNLDRPLGESLGRLVGASDLKRTQRKLFHEHAEDSWAAWQLARALGRGPVYLLSQLDSDLVEELGLAPIADIDELVRLAGRQDSLIVLEDAQHALPGVASEDDDE